jgi:hypothetical protein
MPMPDRPLSSFREKPPTPEEEAEVLDWWIHLPDFIKPSYPFDVPPDRMPFARYVFAKFGDAPRTCSLGVCQRSRQCRGGEGPPCYRERREELRQLLLRTWVSIWYPEVYGEGGGG